MTTTKDWKFGDIEKCFVVDYTEAIMVVRAERHIEKLSK